MEHGEFKDPHIIGKIATLVCQINLNTIFALLIDINRKKNDIDLEQSMHKERNMDFVEIANKDVGQILRQ